MGKRELNKLLKNCKKINIDKESKIVFISDVHRGDGGNTDKLIGNKNIYIAALKYYYKEKYTLIEVGDGDELWKNRNCIDISYIYKEVFTILNRFNNEKRLYMIYGNHDLEKKKPNFLRNQIRAFKKIGTNFGDDFIRLIKNIEFHEGLLLNYKPYDGEIFVTHGHQLDFMNSTCAYVSRFLVRYLWIFLEGIAGFKEPITPATNYEKGTLIDRKLEEYAKDTQKILICGHTHSVKFSKAGEGLYFNDGCCVNPNMITCLEINNGIIAMVKWSIEVRDDNTLYIKRGIVEGPERIIEYFKFLDFN